MKKRLTLAFFDLVILIIAFLITAWIEPGTKRVVLPSHEMPFIYLALIWIVTSSVAGKYKLDFKQPFGNLAFTMTFANLIVLGIASVLVILFQFFDVNRFVLFGTIAIASGFEFFMISVLSIDNKLGRLAKNELKEAESAVAKKLEAIQPERTTQKPDNQQDQHPLMSDDEFNRIKEFVATKIGQEAFNYICSHISPRSTWVKTMSIHELLSVLTLPFSNYSGIINIRKINHLYGINNTLSAINQKLNTEGLFIGCVETYQSRKRRHKEDYGILYYLLEPFDFLIKRVFPRFKTTRKIQNMLRIKVSRAISLTETLGRVVMNGFEIVDYKEIDHIVWFVCKKVAEPKKATQNYGLIFKKSCAGKNGKIIHVYKMRTMHPYSEYLQAYLIKNHGYSDEGHGKIRNDFRISKWGKFMRATWIDEMPQFLNVLKGEMCIVGVRPIRPARLEEFPEDIRVLRQKFKPGCIPPYVSLLMGDEEGNIAAERIYLEEKQKSPHWTDIKYLVKGLYNMFTRKIKSS